MGQSVDPSKHFQGPPMWSPTIQIPQTKEEGTRIAARLDVFHVSSDRSLFSSSLPVLFHGKLNLSDKGCSGTLMEAASCHSKKPDQGEDSFESFQGMESQAIGYCLPDDEEELLAGIMDDFDKSGLFSQTEELEEYDLFSSGGGMELDSDSQESLNVKNNNAISDYTAGGGTGHPGVSNVPVTIVGEHPYGEHPSRTLFVRNINSNVEDRKSVV